MKGEEKGNIPKLPKQIIFDILTRIPARVLAKNFRCICKSWLAYISDPKFIAQNAMRNQTQLLIQVPAHTNSLYFDTKSLVMDHKELDYTLNTLYACQFPRFANDCNYNIFGFVIKCLPRIGRISSSCNGFLLLNDHEEEGWLFIVNIVSKFFRIIPPCPSCCPHKHCGSALGFDPITRQYKVVHLYSDGFGFEIMRLGSSESDNEWKVIPGPFHEEPYDRPERIQWSDPVTIKGQFFHWFASSNQYIISMDISEEKSRKIYLPRATEKDKYALVELGGNLSYVCNDSCTEIHVWILVDFQNQEWVKKHSIAAEFISYVDINGQYFQGGYKYNRKALPKLCNLSAVASLRNGQVIMFKHKREKIRMYLFDLNRMEMKQFKVRMFNHQKFVPHTPTLYNCLDNFDGVPAC